MNQYKQPVYDRVSCGPTCVTCRYDQRRGRIKKWAKRGLFFAFWLAYAWFLVMGIHAVAVYSVTGSW